MKSLLPHRLLALSLAAALSVSACAAPSDDPASTPAPQRHTIADREVLIDVPSHPSPEALIISFHGYGLDAEDNRQRNQLVRTGAVVAYPQGEQAAAGQAWSTAPYASTTVAEDAAFVDEIIAEVEAEHAIEDVYLVGFSNGAGFAAEYACANPDRISGVATFSGVYYPAERSECNAPIPQLTVHGGADTTISIDGGQRHGETYLPARVLVEQAAERNGCAGETRETEEFRVHRTIDYQKCVVPLRFVEVTGGMHYWPGAADDPNPHVPEGFGTELVADFFGLSG